MATVDVLIKAVAEALEKPDDPQVCYTILDAIPDGWAKVDGVWVQVRRSEGYADQTEHEGEVLLVLPPWNPADRPR